MIAGWTKLVDRTVDYVLIRFDFRAASEHLLITWVSITRADWFNYIGKCDCFPLFFCSVRRCTNAVSSSESTKTTEITRAPAIRASSITWNWTLKRLRNGPSTTSSWTAATLIQVKWIEVKHQFVKLMCFLLVDWPISHRLPRVWLPVESNRPAHRVLVQLALLPAGHKDAARLRGHCSDLPPVAQFRRHSRLVEQRRIHHRLL